jgi:hypothetical protein
MESSKGLLRKRKAAKTGLKGEAGMNPIHYTIIA